MRLLLVEDDRQLIETLKKDLELAGFAVDVAENGIDAEFLGNESIYDIAILDLGLPQRNGIEVLTNWRRDKNPLPVIVLTARDAWHERVDGFNAGADDYLGKPFHVEELLARITALLHRSVQQPGGSLNVAGLCLNEEKQSVTTEDMQEHNLTGIEFRLLRYFLLNLDHVLSKSKITDHIYDNDAEKDSNVIEVYVRHLRKILGKNRIETRRGQGYIFRQAAE